MSTTPNRPAARGNPTPLLALCLAGLVASDGAAQTPFHDLAVDVGMPDCSWLIAADIDGDGDMDAVASTASKVVWLENVGNAAPGPWHVLPSTGTGWARQIRAGDLDGDGDVDIVRVRLDAGIWALSWHRNLDGAGTFAAAVDVHFDQFQLATDFRLVDVDDDGDLDIVAGFQQGFVPDPDFLGWFENTDGAGTFGALQAAPDTFESMGYGIVVEDLDLDGDFDPVLALQIPDEVRWYHDVDGTGNFVLAGTRSADPSTREIGAGDLDGDGDPDIVAGGSSTLEWFRNDGGNLAAGVDLPGGADHLAEQIDTADLDLDGDVDVFVTNSKQVGSVASWYENLGGAVFVRRALVSADVTPDVGKASALVDVDGDGDLDAWVAEKDSDSIQVFRNDTQWKDLGGASSPPPSPPVLLADGSLFPGTPLTLGLDGAPADAPFLLWLSFTSTPLTVLGGTLHAFPKTTQLFAVADATGAWDLAFAWPAVAAGVEFRLQAIVQDATVPDGLTLSNGLLGRTR